MEILSIFGLYLATLVFLTWVNSWAANYSDNINAFAEAFFTTTSAYIFVILLFITFGVL